MDDAARHCLAEYGVHIACLVTLLLDGSRNPIATVVVQQERVRDTNYLAREVFRSAMLNNASAFYLVRILPRRGAGGGLSERMVRNLRETSRTVGISMLGFVTVPGRMRACAAS